MSQIAAILLMYLNEEDAFWALSQLLTNSKHAMHGETQEEMKTRRRENDMFIQSKTNSFLLKRIKIYETTTDLILEEGTYCLISKYYVSESSTTHHLWPANLFFLRGRVFYPGISQAAPFPGPS